MNKANSAYVMLHGPDMVKDADGKDMMLHIRLVKNNENLDLFGYKLTKVAEDIDVEHWTWDFEAPAVQAGGEHHAGTGYAESNKKKYEAAVEARIKSIEDNIKIQAQSRITELAIQAGLIAPYASNHEGLANFDYRKFAELITQDIYDKIRKELIDDATIDAEPDVEDRCYLRGSNGGIVDALCIVKNFGVDE